MVDFAAYCTIHAIKIGFQKYYILPRWCAHHRLILNKLATSIVLDAYLHNKMAASISYIRTSTYTKLDLLLHNSNKSIP